MRDMDIIEVGKGNQSKVIGTNNSISEYMTTILAILFYVVQAWLIVFTILFLTIGYYWLPWGVAAIIAALLSTLAPVLVVAFVVWLLRVMKGINEPLPVRDERGRFTRTARVNVMGRHVGDIKTADTGESEYVERWGGGVD